MAGAANSFWTTTWSSKDAANLRPRQKTNLPSGSVVLTLPTEGSHYAPVHLDYLNISVRPKVP